MCYNYSLTVFNNVEEFEEVFNATFKEETIPSKLEDYY
jgi:hypothetical protein